MLTSLDLRSLQLEDGIDTLVEFRVARVSKVLRDGTDEPRTEVSVTVGDDLVVSPVQLGGVLLQSHQYRNVLRADGRMPYSPDRLLKCRAIRDGVAELGKKLKDLFAEDGSAASNLDSLSHAGRLLAGVPDPEEVSR